MLSLGQFSLISFYMKRHWMAQKKRQRKEGRNNQEIIEEIFPNMNELSPRCLIEIPKLLTYRE